MSALPQEPRLRADPTVVEGGVIVVEVAADVTQVTFRPDGHPATRVPVVGGRAEYRLPTTVLGGTTVAVSDMNFPKPTTIGVRVMGGQNS
jgi:hypothetical protein